MSYKVHKNFMNTDEKNNLSWEGITDEVWQTILSDFFFKVADSFGFMKVLEKNDLFPKGLNYFENWQLEEVDLAEVHTDIICKFKLNENCKQKLLEKDFAVHQRGKLVDYKQRDDLNYYYEFDELYFFSGKRLIGFFVNHEDTIEFKNLDKREVDLINELDKTITNDRTS